MRGTQSPQASPPRAAWLSRAALALYPPAWRARYGEEVLALLDESGGGLRAVASVAWRAMPAWIWPPGHLYDRPTRMRASLATTSLAWTVLIGLGLVFAQLTQFQGFRPPGHPVVGGSYGIFDAALALSALAVAGTVPLWLLMLRQARREHRPRDTAYLLLPVLAPAAYGITVVTTVKLVRHADGVGPWWFLAYTVLGFAAAAAAAAGPGLALRRLRPRGPAVRMATFAAGLAVVAMDLAAAASSVAAVGLYLWARDFAGYHDTVVLGAYLALAMAAATVATVSAERGARAALAGPGGG
jgi:hypothetical protein